MIESGPIGGRGHAQRLRVGLIGAGRIGRGHAAILASRLPRADLVAIADTNAAAAQSAAEATRVPRWTTGPDAIITDPAIDAVVIASATDTHAPLIAAAARAGKHVFCEKPIALDLEATDAALDAVATAGVRLQIGFQRRFDPGYRKAKDLIDAGAIGTVEAVHDAMRDPAPPPRSYLLACGGLFRDMTIHNFDCVRWLMGREVDELFAMGSALVDPMFAALGDVDTGVVSLRFDGGGLASIENSRRSGFGYDVRTEIFGSDGALVVGYQQATPVVRLSADGVSTDHVHFFQDRFADAYVAELRAFVDAIIDDGPVAPSGADARAALALAFAAEASRRENRPVSPARFARLAPEPVDAAAERRTKSQHPTGERP